MASLRPQTSDVVDVLNEAIVNKADKTYVDELIANIPTESDIVIVDCPDGSTISHSFEQVMTAVNKRKAVYVSIYGTIIAPLVYIADDGSFVEFSTIQDKEVNGLVINNDDSFFIKKYRIII